MDATTIPAMQVSANYSSDNMADYLRSIHHDISRRYPFIDRVAIALYDAPSDLLKTFVSSNHDEHLLERYEARLTDVPSLSQLATAHQTRVVGNIKNAFNAHSRHSQWLLDRGYQSSLTVPVYQGADLAAFLFFDSKSENAFEPTAVNFLEIFADLISQLLLLRLRLVRGLVGTVQIASGLARIRDLETGQHLERMAAYSRLMARAVAEQFSLSDEFIEYLFLFAPLHDVGKIGIPDSILLKPGKLDEQEWIVMRRHVDIGVNIIDKITQTMELEPGLAARVMRNVVAYHHERGDGSGYPNHFLLAQIPIESRIIAIADVYDALSNKRPYKEAWNEEDTLIELRKEVSLGRLDGHCVEALIAARDERFVIQKTYEDYQEPAGKNRDVPISPDPHG